MPAATSLYDELLLLIGVATTIDDTAKKAMISAIERGGLTPELLEQVTKLFHAEAGKLDGEVSNAEEALTLASDIGEEDEEANTPAFVWLGSEYEAATHEIEDALTASCRREVNAVDKDVEGEKRQFEQNDIEALRQSLKS